MSISHARYLFSLPIIILSFTNCSGSTTPATAIGSQARVSETAQQLTSPCPCLYVVNGSSVTVYASHASGNAKPIQDISGSKTGLESPVGVAVDGGDNIYVSNGYEIAVYAAGATGNVAPTRVINGPPYRRLEGDVINPINGDIYVAIARTNEILIYATNAVGTATRIGDITGSQTGLNGPWGVALDKSGNIYVTNHANCFPGDTGNPTVTVYAAGSTGNVAPARTITGTRTGLDCPQKLALDSNSNIYVANTAYPSSGSGSLTVYAAGANGNVAPTETIEGALTQLNVPEGIAVDSSGNIYATNFDASSITVYAAGSNGNVAPITTIAGAETGLAAPQGIVIH
jgi:hypothetical protein